MATETRVAGQPGMMIGGERRPAKSGKTFPTYDPATGQVLAEVAAGSKADVDDAVGVARAALKSKTWGRIAPAERSQVMWRFAQKIRDHRDELAKLESQDVGKALREAKGDASVCARYFEFYAGVADKIDGHTIPMPDGFTAYTVREPMGVSAHIIPWNYPLQIAGRGVGAALACGNTVVVKPSSEAPLSILRLSEIALEASLPPGVFNVVTGSATEVGEPLAGHPGVNQVTFTGSISAGVRVMQLAAENAVPVQLELGGKSPQIVFADADVDDAVTAIGRGIFQNAGQTCSAGSRLLVERRFHGTLVAKLAERARSLKLGPGIEDPDMGPLVSRRQLERVVNYVETGRKDGAAVAIGGARADDPRLRAGYFFQPTILEGVQNDAVVAREEIFGPVLVAIDFDDLDEVAALANQSEYGLIAGIWTRDIKKAHYLASRVEAGQIYVNTYGAGGGVELPFGGYRKSGFGREKGLEGLAAYSQVKTVCIKYA
jgi:acyl-CoA reductase-like NAD-dependent aldehyde dehydrogenase